MKKIIFSLFLMFIFQTSYSQTNSFTIGTFIVSDGETETEFPRKGKIELFYNSASGVYETFTIKGEDGICPSYSLDLTPEETSQFSHIYKTDENDVMEIVFKDIYEIVIYHYQCNGIFHIYNIYKKGYKKL